MKIEFEDETYTLDVDHIRLKQARVIQRHTGLSIDGWADSVNVQLDADGNPKPILADWLESISALYWLMLAQSGREEDIGDVDFDVQGFYQVFIEGRVAELEALVAEQARKKKPDPTRPRPGQKGAQTASRARSSRTATTRTPPAPEPEDAATGS